ncbi:MAG: alanine racemase [Ignavibacteria bacterium]|nr:alanine racemase [Ignavibacteria bacterium]
MLCLGLITEKNELTENLAGRNIEFSVADLRSAKMLNDVGKKLNRKPVIHIQVDTGINRTGIRTEDAYDTAAEISKLKTLMSRNFILILQQAKYRATDTRTSVKKIQRSCKSNRREYFKV